MSRRKYEEMSEEELLQEAIRQSVEEEENRQRKLSQIEEKKSLSSSSIVVSNCGPYPWVSLANANKAWQMKNKELNNGVLNLCVSECGAGGDCLFYAIANGMYIAYANDPMFSGISHPSKSTERMKLARKWLADSLTIDNIDQFLYDYQQEKFSSEQSGSGTWPDAKETWKPEMFGSTKPVTFRIPTTQQVIKKSYPMPPALEAYLNVDHPNFQFYVKVLPPNLSGRDLKLYSARSFRVDTMKQLVQKTGRIFQGDTHVLEYIVQGNNPINRNSIGFIVVTSFGKMDCQVYPKDEQRNYYMLLYYLPGHWKLGGYAVNNQQVQVIFPRQNLPDIIRLLYEDSCGGMLEILQ